ncbi:hypothetical protein CC1G_03882 [Coprinopsis cinerea okayama7|uniref:rRNA-processing protein FYV7 n=1 Tax=Coprinopsis cinerea (strain Okayama-7 / 130 / ATCC MYA-4618 / FGSC 9003) TaxID=240176 RepID=A8NH29_COPC7|nr:hypothetical protein CC1G_03882 [Coprinopsis cinerea okayama7\|eukprot:XP_001833665.1 hypothetical protein CC1G_03882 [Coprinopsis cinerea okayama7\
MDSPKSRKRKNPPTFQHLPVQQAKKLKKAWVEKAKIKSKWKAEKRKLYAEGGIPKMPWEIEGDQDDEEAETVEKDEDEETEWGGVGADSDSSKSGDEDDLEPLPPTGSPPNTRSGQGGRQRGSSKRDSRNAQPYLDGSNKRPRNRGDKKADGSDDEEPRQPTLRDLKREAYSRSTLHTYKSDPLRKRGAMSNRGRGRGGFERGKGRGQPNMKLRMNVMLEKIKRDIVPASS